MSAKTIPTAKFRLGRIISTRHALEVITQDDILAAITRHQAGDWGEVCQDVQNANAQALLHGTRIVSVYRSNDGVRFWIITEADRSATTVFLPGDC